MVSIKQKSKVFKITSMLDKLYKWKWVIFSLFFIIIIFLNISGQFSDLGGDSAQYIILAEFFANGGGYRAVNYPGSPFFYHYPPVFPLLLTPIIYFFGRNIYLMHIWIVLLGYGSLFFIYKLFKRYADEKIAFFATVLFATNWIFVIYSARFILSDIPYLFISFLTLFSASRYLKKETVYNKEGFLTITGLVLCYLTRYAGVSLFAGVLAVLLVVSTRAPFKKVKFIVVGFLIPIFLWHITARILNPSSIDHYFSKQLFLVDPYRPFLGTIIDSPKYIIFRFIEGVNYYYKIIASSLFPEFIIKSPLLGEFILFFSIVMTLGGLWLKLREDKTCVIPYYFLFYFILIVLWPFREGARFILPILPFIYFYFFIALKKIFKFSFKRIFYVVVLVFVIFNSISLSKRSYAYHDLPKTLKNFISVHNWIDENISDEGIVFSRKPTVTFFYTKNQSIVYPFTLDPDEIWSSIQRNDIKYIILDEFSLQTYLYLRPFVDKYKDEFKILKTIGNTRVLEVVKN